MTREEARKWLKTFKGHTGMAELSQAFDVAIEALEQEPCEDKRLYIKVFADLEPDDIAEKIYQICDEDKFPKVVESLKEYFDSEPCEDCISREKAKQFLYEKLDRLNDNELYDIFSRIIDDMYNELPSVEQNPKEVSCDDAISRQAVEKITWEESSYIDPINALTEVREKIRALPSIAPQQKVKKWIEEVDDYGEVMCWHCDKCYEDSGFATTCKWDYCPNCGCLMKGEGE